MFHIFTRRRDRRREYEHALNLLRANRYPHLNDSQWQFFLAIARRRDLCPVAGQINAAIEMGPRCADEVRAIIAIEGRRLLAHRSGLYAGIEPIAFAERPNAKPGDPPFSATATVYRGRGDDAPTPFRATAYFDEDFPGNIEKFGKCNTLWDERPRLCLGQYAEVGAYRIAFPQEFADIDEKGRVRL